MQSIDMKNITISSTNSKSNGNILIKNSGIVNIENLIS